MLDLESTTRSCQPRPDRGRWRRAVGRALVIGVGFIDAKPSDSPKLATPSRSTTIALTSPRTSSGSLW